MIHFYLFCKEHLALNQNHCEGVEALWLIQPGHNFTSNVHMLHCATYGFLSRIVEIKTSTLFKTQGNFLLDVSSAGCLVFQTKMYIFTLLLSITPEVFR